MWSEMVMVVCSVFVFTQKTAYEMRISDWSSDVCSSDLTDREQAGFDPARAADADGRVDGDSGLVLQRGQQLVLRGQILRGRAPACLRIPGGDERDRKSVV